MRKRLFCLCTAILADEIAYYNHSKIRFFPFQVLAQENNSLRKNGFKKEDEIW